MLLDSVLNSLWEVTAFHLKKYTEKQMREADEQERHRSESFEHG